jgi:hypothetical protein
MAAKKKKSNGGAAAAVLPQFIDNSLNLLLADLTSPESQVKFDPPSRSNAATIQNTISPPQATWTWADVAARDAEIVSDADVGKYGLQQDVNTLFRLTSASPTAVWRPAQNFTVSTWTWLNLAARLAQPVLPADVGKVGLQSDIYTFYLLTNAVPPVWQPVADPTATTQPFELSTGAADADSFHDFFRLKIAFQDMWTELLDERIGKLGQQLYATWDALMDNSSGAYDDTGITERRQRFALAPVDQDGNPIDIAGATELQNFISQLQGFLGIPQLSTGSAASGVSADLQQLKQAVMDTLNGCNMLLTELNRVGQHAPVPTVGAWNPDKWINATPGNPDDPGAIDDMAAFPAGTERKDVFNYVTNELSGLAPSDGSGAGPSDPQLVFPDITTLLQKLDGLLRERYRFDVFAPASINYGLLLNYRQHWHPQSYQVGNLVSTIPLAPQETRKYTTKTVVKKSRSVKEISESLRSGKDETDQTSRVDA